MCSPCSSKPRSRSSRKPSAASTRTGMALSASQTFGRPTPSSVSVPEEELDAMLQEGKGPINFTVFLTLFGEKLNGTDPEEAILSAFRMFDPSGKGVVNKDEFKQLLLTQADKFSLAEVEQMFALTPMDLAGDIDYKSLCYIITHGDEKEE
ncbi:myosin regulatory light chain 2, atrial isoform isoform X3 [Eumetopias jubatus]|uniref:Myosin regulatory light chain 2, atrial isoform isoform X3 n=1 Tax=Callorhinus ursinus TaxID=34884 RepID=A0A3Q7MPA0_CALUR|nr:PREDICTED: myosin regulatory light chain 2, atrial isoform isoform X3 [Odobenus rosmarus divergens]XP_025708910.1 myosin regulatory light chain 2, atrial isoform isoform X3 [Callorhinus ursinus]XP_027951205.1 myosin regulatory light chain 2, atrial isoform isoform X3 [Eumetopias jubatus]